MAPKAPLARTSAAPRYISACFRSSCVSSNTCRKTRSSAADMTTFRRAITRRATSRLLPGSYVVSSSAPPQENEGMYFGGNPAPNTLLDTPTTVPVLNIVLMALLE